LEYTNAPNVFFMWQNLGHFCTSVRGHCRWTVCSNNALRIMVLWESEIFLGPNLIHQWRQFYTLCNIGTSHVGLCPVSVLGGIWGSHGGDYADGSLLGSSAVCSCRSLPRWRRQWTLVKGW
jgi:hypothetical protein